MAATTLSFISLLFSLDSHHHLTMLFFTFFFLFFFALSLCSIALLLFLLYNNGVRTAHKTEHKPQTDPSIFTFSSTKAIDKTHQPPHQTNPTQLSRSLLLEILPSNSSEWETLFQDEKGFGTDPVSDGSVMDSDKDGAGDLGVEKSVNKKKKKKKRAKKKRSCSPNSKGEDNMVDEKCGEKDELGLKEKQELVCAFRFTSSSSPTQRKIKQQFDQLVKCHESKKITLAQIGQFANCLIEARHELQHKSEVIQRKFTITKALLYKADRSSFDRLSQQIYKLEMEQKRLEEDALVYNLLQQQLKLSPAYKKMLEISACLEELKDKSGKLIESADPEYTDISFEDFLAQEKKDSFWQKNGKSRSYSS